MQKYIGGIEGFLEQDAAKESAFWADYQVLGPMFAALRMFMTMDDVLTVIVGAKGCAYHLNFTIVAWGEIDFFLGKRPLPVLEYRQQQIALGDFTPPEDWLRRMKKLCGVYGARRIVLLPTDALLLCGADLAGVAGERLWKSRGCRVPISGRATTPLWRLSIVRISASPTGMKNRSTWWAGCGRRATGDMKSDAVSICSKSFKFR